MKKIISLLFVTILMTTACEKTENYEEVGNKREQIVDVEIDVNQRGQLEIESLEEIDHAIEMMTLEEKAGQIIQAERGGITLEEIAAYNIGSILSGGGSAPEDNSPEGWVELYNNIQEASRNSSSGIPVIYGIDAVHGHNNVKNATIFPHNIGLGAANNPDLVEEIARATAREIKATGLNWNFSPAVPVVQDIRWGRTYESYSEDAERVAILGSAYVVGLQDEGIIATTKHFIGDGHTTFGTGEGDNLIDRGDVTVDSDELYAVNIPAYEAAIEAGTNTIMASFNSIDGLKVHGDKSILTDLLRDDLGFEGLVISDWEAIHALGISLKYQVAIALDAGIDLLMQPYNWKEVHEAIVENVSNGDVSEERLNEAVKRNLVLKYEAGLFASDYESQAGEIRTDDSIALARKAVSQSMVLLKNEETLPLEKDANVYLMGPAADNVGIQCGGWTSSWQGEMNSDLFEGISLKDAFEEVLTLNGGSLVDNPSEADVIVLAIGEKPYAEMFGDTADLSVNGPVSLQSNLEAIEEASTYNLPTVTIMIAGRPLLVDDYLGQWDSFVMTWLPGTEGNGVTDVLFGDTEFTGTLPITWPKTNDQASDSVYMDEYEAIDHQFKYGYGLVYE